MKIGFINDIHYDNNDYILNRNGYSYSMDRMIQDTLDIMEEEDLDYLFITGDISNREGTREIARILNSTKTKVYYVPGNHDVWGSSTSNTWEELEKFKEDEYCLIDKSLQLTERVAVVGMFSWYDSSLETMGKDEDYYEKRKYLWADGKRTCWGKNNGDIVDNQILKAKEVLKGVEAAEIILMNHFVPLKDFIVHKPYDKDWNFGNGFMGTDKVAEMIQKDARIKYVTFGHTHKNFGKVVKNGVTYLSGPVGYFNEWTIWDFKGQFKKSLITLTI